MYIITGGGSGIGKSLALALADRGKPVLIVGRRENLLKETASISSLIDYYCVDISTQEGRHEIKDYLKLQPQISALVNNAGILEPLISLKNMGLDEWHQTLNTNLDAALFLPQLLNDKLQSGRVLNIGSGAAYFAIKGWSAYCVSKAALSMLTQCWQLESDSPAFASVMPGITDTNMQALARQGVNMAPEQTDFYKKIEQNNRLISSETVAEFLVWLLLDVSTSEYVSKEWDIYDTDHHKHWLKAPHQVLHWDF